MFLLRRVAARAVAPSPSIFVKPRSITTLTPLACRTRQQWSAPFLQKRFASDDVKVEDDFAQTATEAPIEENLTPAQEAAQAPATDAASTVGADQLEFAANTKTVHRSTKRPLVEPSKVVYVGNLFYEVTLEQLQRVFSRFGEIKDSRIVFDNRGMSRGFAYIEYVNIEDAQTAIENLDMQVFEGRNLVVQFHRPNSNSNSNSNSGGFRSPNNSPPSKTLFIGNMSFEMSDKDLNDLFRDVRNVLDVRVAIDRRTGQPRGFAHADFVDVASATQAKESLSQKVIYGRQLRIDYSKSASTNRHSRRESSDEPTQE